MSVPTPPAAFAHSTAHVPMQSHQQLVSALREQIRQETHLVPKAREIHRRAERLQRRAQHGAADQQAITAAEVAFASSVRPDAAAPTAAERAHDAAERLKTSRAADAAMAALRMSLEDRNRQLAEAEEEIAALRESNEELAASCDDFAQQRQIAQRELQTATATIERIRRERDELAARSRQQAVDVAEARAALEAVTSERDVAEHASESITDALYGAKREAQTLASRVESLNAQLADARRRESEATARANAEADEVRSSLEVRTSRAESKLAQAQASTKVVEEQVKALQTTLELREKGCASMQSKLEEARAASSQTANATKKFEEERDTLNARLRTERAASKEARLRATEMENEMRSMVAQHSKERAAANSRAEEAEMAHVKLNERLRSALTTTTTYSQPQEKPHRHEPPPQSMTNGAPDFSMERVIMAQREAWQEDVLEMAVERAMRRDSAKKQRESARKTISGLKAKAARAAAKISGAMAEAQRS